MTNALPTLNELQKRITKATAGHPLGSSAQVWAAREVVEQAHRDGLLSKPPKWLGPRRVLLYIGDDPKPIETRIITNAKDL